MNVQRNTKSVKRPYTSRVRDKQAESTRQSVLDAAEELFLSRGYAKTSMMAIADRAEVSRQTVYDTFGDKARLLYAVGTRVVMGEDTGGKVEDSARWGPIREEPDLTSRIRFAANATRTMWESGMVAFEAMTYEAAVSDPRLDDMLREAVQKKRRNTEVMVRLLVQDSDQRDESQVGRLIDYLVAVDSAFVVKTLIEDLGWTYDQYEDWLAQVLTRLLASNGFG